MNLHLSLKFKVLSFVLIIFVIFLHSYNLTEHSPEALVKVTGINFLQEVISFGITRVAVPIFFFISGYFFFTNFKLKTGVIKEKLLKRISTLLIPYVLWSILIFIFYFLLQSLPPMVKYFNRELVTNLSIDEIFRRILLDPIPYQLWFVRDLMLLVIISPLIYSLIKYGKVLFLSILIIAWMQLFSLVVVSNEALLFFCVGGYFQLNNTPLEKNNSAKYGVLITLLWIFSLIIRVHLMNNGQLNLLENTYFYKINILLGIVAIWLLYDGLIGEKESTKLRKLKPLNYSFSLYLLHEPILTIFKKIFFKVFGASDNSSIMIFFLAPILTIAVSLLIADRVSRFFPRVYKVLTGNRIINS